MKYFAHRPIGWLTRVILLTTLPALLFVIPLTLTGCHTVNMGQRGRVSSFQPGIPPAPPIPPRQVEYTGQLNIVVAQHGTNVVITNREPVVYRNFQLWLNQQYVAVVEQLNVGQTLHLPLNAFTNPHGERFPLGSILAIDKRGRVYQSALYLLDNADPADSEKHEQRYVLLTRKPNP